MQWEAPQTPHTSPSPGAVGDLTPSQLLGCCEAKCMHDLLKDLACTISDPRIFFTYKTVEQVNDTMSLFNNAINEMAMGTEPESPELCKGINKIRAASRRDDMVECRLGCELMITFSRLLFHVPRFCEQCNSALSIGASSNNIPGYSNSCTMARCIEREMIQRCIISSSIFRGFLEDIFYSNARTQKFTF